MMQFFSEAPVGLTLLGSRSMIILGDLPNIVYFSGYEILRYIHITTVYAHHSPHPNSAPDSICHCQLVLGRNFHLATEHLAFKWPASHCPVSGDTADLTRDDDSHHLMRGRNAKKIPLISHCTLDPGVDRGDDRNCK